MGRGIQNGRGSERVVVVTKRVAMLKGMDVGGGGGAQTSLESALMLGT